MATILQRKRLFSFTFVIALLFGAGIAFGDEAIEARKSLKEMGMEYSEQNFAKAAGSGDRTAVQLFIKAGMDVNAGGGAAIGLSAGRGQKEMVSFLLSQGAKPTANALQFARTRGYPDIAKILEDAGAKE